MKVVGKDGRMKIQNSQEQTRLFCGHFTLENKAKIKKKKERTDSRERDYILTMLFVSIKPDILANKVAYDFRVTWIDNILLSLSQFKFGFSNLQPRVLINRGLINSMQCCI